MISYLRTVFSLDLRSLALLRILLATLILVQIWTLLPDAEALLSDSGVLPREKILGRDPWALSLYMVFKSGFQVRVLLLIHSVFAIGLLMGYKTRLCSVFSWLLLMSMHNRNPWMINGGDHLMLLLSFWIIFLPVHARASLDSLLSKQERPKSDSFFDAASVALILQICLVYWCTVILKSDPAWWNGSAVGITLECDQFVKPFGIFLRDLPALHAPLTYGTIFWEALGPVLLFIPIFNSWMRLGAIFGFTLFHTGLEFSMALGLFPMVCITAWLTLLPGNVWDRIAPLASLPLLAKARETLSRLDLNPGPLPKQPGVWIRVLLSALIIYIIMWNIRSINYDMGKKFLPREANAPALMLRIRQKWSMFSPGPPRKDGWYVMRGLQFNGNEIDLMTDGAPLTWEKPELVIDQFPHHHWRKYYSNLRKPRLRHLRRPLGDYLIRQWNESVDVGFQLREAELWYVMERTGDDEIAEPEPVRLWRRENINFRAS